MLVDHAEYNNSISEGVVTDLPLTIRFARTSSDKGLIETMFNVFRNYFKGISKSLQTKSLHDISQQIARKKACLTINEMYIIASIFIVHFNNKHVMEDFPMTKEMIVDGVRPIPNDIFAWGVKNRPGYLNIMSENQLYLKLLEKSYVSVRREFVYFEKYGLKYTCNWTLSEGLQDKKLSGNKAIKLPCRYFRGMANTIFISTTEGLKIATLHNDHNAFYGFSFPEIVAFKQDRRPMIDKLKIEEDNSLAIAEELLRSCMKSAELEKKSSSLPPLERIKGNRDIESIFDRVRQVNRYLSAVESEYFKFSHNTDSEFKEISSEGEYAAYEASDHYYPRNDEDSDFYSEED
mgnify:FL=1